MSDTAREPIAHLWQHKETGRVYYQGPHDEAPQSTYALIGPLFLGASIPPHEPTEAMMCAGAKSIILGQETRPGSSWADEAAWAWLAMYDAALAEKGKK